MLARDLGRTLTELCETMSAQEFGDHLRDYQQRPWGGLRLDLNAAKIVQAVHNMAGKVLKKDIELSDCVLRFKADAPDSEEPEVSPIEHFTRINRAGTSN